MNRKQRLGIAAAAVALAAGAIGPVAVTGPASAVPAGLEVEGETSAASSVDKTIKADCPAGKVVTGGAGYLTTSPDVQGNVALDRLEPAADGSGFTATMREVLATPDTWRLTAVAVCVPAPAGWQVISATGLNQQQIVTTPSCGTRSVIGMGGRINGGSGDVVLDDVQPSFDLKTVTVRGFPVPGGADAAWSVTAFAVCANTPPGLQRIAFTTPSSSDSDRSGSVGCPDGKALYGAGAAIGAGNGSVLLTGVNIAPQDTARAWAHEIAGGYGNSWNITAYGICGS